MQILRGPQGPVLKYLQLCKSVQMVKENLAAQAAPYLVAQGRRNLAGVESYMGYFSNQLAWQSSQNDSSFTLSATLNERELRPV